MVKRYQMQESLYGTYIQYRDYHEALSERDALRARLAEAEKANSACAKTAQENAEAADRMRELAGKEAARRRDVEAQRDGLKTTLDIIQSGFEYRDGDPKMDGTFERFQHVLNRSRMMDIAREGLAKLEETK